MNDAQFPTLAYKGKGQHPRSGGTYDYVAIEDQAAMDTALASGWFATLPEAIDAADTPQPPAPPEDNAPPTRKELEAKAKELAVKFTAKTTDAELNNAITAALAKAGE